MNNKKFTTYDLCVIGLMAALVFVATNFRIKIPIGGDSTMLHLGNVMCLLSGALFGPLPGGLASGFGSAIFDLSSEYASEAWITFINKFVMGYVTGFVAHRICGKSHFKYADLIGGVCGSASYIVLYLFKGFIEQRIVLGAEMPVVVTILSTKALTSIINGIVAVIASVIISASLRPALKSAGIFSRLKFCVADKN